MPEERDMVEQVKRLNRQVVQLYQQGRYAEALALAQQVCERARGFLGEEHPRHRPKPEQPR
jgi:hypothetical protein